MNQIRIELKDPLDSNDFEEIQYDSDDPDFQHEFQQININFGN